MTTSRRVTNKKGAEKAVKHEPFENHGYTFSGNWESKHALTGSYKVYSYKALIGEWTPQYGWVIYLIKASATTTKHIYALTDAILNANQTYHVKSGAL